uniref:Phosphatidylinositol transfer protein alpha isoform n=1 Tax=Mastacembelus armatus TaxID=205130 RepID=A0A3Q3LCJ4_9TELE
MYNCVTTSLHVCVSAVLWRFTRRPGMHTLTVEPNAYMKDKFMIKIETWHKPDMGDQDNVHGLDKSTWAATEIVNIDIADRSSVSAKDYKPESDPAIFKSQKTGRGPLGPDWKKELANNPNCPRMCAYKLVTVEFKWMGLQGKMENFIQKVEKRLFTNFHRQLFCWIDNWINLSMDDIRRMEEETKKELDEVSTAAVTCCCKDLEIELLVFNVAWCQSLQCLVLDHTPFTLR